MITRHEHDQIADALMQWWQSQDIEMGTAASVMAELTGCIAGTIATDSENFGRLVGAFSGRLQLAARLTYEGERKLD